MTFSTMMEVTEILCSFRLLLDRRVNKNIPESFRLEFSEKFLANKFALSDTENNITKPLNKGGIAGFWEVIDSLYY